MKSAIKTMSIIEYFKNNRPWECCDIKNPRWEEAEPAIRKMDNYYFPIVLLSCHSQKGQYGFDDEDAFNIVGGDGKFALFHMTGDWQYEDANKSSKKVRLWESDQGYFCQEKNILYDINKVLQIVKEFYQTGSYRHIQNFIERKI